MTASLTSGGTWPTFSRMRCCWLRMRDLVAVIVEQDRVRRVVELGAVLELGQVRGDGHEHAERERDDPEQQQRDEDREQPQLLQAGALAVRLQRLDRRLARVAERRWRRAPLAVAPLGAAAAGAGATVGAGGAAAGRHGAAGGRAEHRGASVQITPGWRTTWGCQGDRARSSGVAARRRNGRRPANAALAPGAGTWRHGPHGRRESSIGTPCRIRLSRPTTPPSTSPGNAVESLPRGALAAKLAVAAAGRPAAAGQARYRPDGARHPSRPRVVLAKLREFQDLGHRVVLIIGDYTARVGDPSGRSTTRPILTDAEIEANAQTYQEQAFAILDPDPERLEVRRNGEWLDMSMVDLLRLARTTTVAQLLERDDFSKRMRRRAADLDARDALPAAAGLRLGDGRRRRRARRHRPDVQPAARPATSSSAYGSRSRRS